MSSSLSERIDFLVEPCRQVGNRTDANYLRQHAFVLTRAGFLDLRRAQHWAQDASAGSATAFSGGHGDRTHMAPRSFPAPWTVIDIPGGYRVEDATGQALGYFYSWDDPSAKHQTDVLTRDEAFLMATNFAKVPELLL